MSDMLLDQLFLWERTRAGHPALIYQGAKQSYATLAQDVRTFARALSAHDISPQDRVGLFLDKQFEAASAIMGVAAAGCVLVPINPALRTQQVAHILRDCNVRTLITTNSRAVALSDELIRCPDLRCVVTIDVNPSVKLPENILFEGWSEFCVCENEDKRNQPAVDIDALACIAYTSGSTGGPKGVMHTHRSLATMASTVAHYLEYERDDRILNLPAYSFGFGFSQLFSSLHAGITAVLHNYLTLDDLRKAIIAEKVTGVSGVPTVMSQLTELEWPKETINTIRYFSVAGGRMPEAETRALRARFPRSKIYLMYGLTEALRSTYLAPDEIDLRPKSIGKAIPGVTISVLRPDGSPCDPNEPGELVHEGALVSLGYWNDPERTAAVFRPAPGAPPGSGARAVWTGDLVTRDEAGFLYYVSRADRMIKSRGYRISPTEIEDVICADGQVDLAAAIGVEDPSVGQAIVVFVTPKNGRKLNIDAILTQCRRQLPAYMMPREIIARDTLPLNANHKVDNKRLAEDYAAATAAPNINSPKRATDISPGFFRRWINHALEISGVQRKTFKSVRDVFAWNFPSHHLRPRDSFVSLQGDSLSYVAVATGLEEYLGHLPKDWEQKCIENLETLSRTIDRRNSVPTDIALRALAIIAIISTHGEFLPTEGTTGLLMALSGLSFARFNWSKGPGDMVLSVLHLMGRILVPSWVIVVAIYLYFDKFNWGVTFFYENLVSVDGPNWWAPAWFAQVLFQIWIVLTAIAAIPAVLRFSRTHPYTFSLLLTCSALILHVSLALFWHSPMLSYTALPQYYLWVYCMGFLLHTARAPKEKIGAFLCSLIFIVAAVLVRDHTGNDVVDNEYLPWLVGGLALVLWVPAISIPGTLKPIIIIIARASLYIFLFHWPLAKMAEEKFPQHFMGLTQWQLCTLFGFLVSVLIWIVIEATISAFKPTDALDGGLDIAAASAPGAAM